MEINTNEKRDDKVEDIQVDEIFLSWSEYLDLGLAIPHLIRIGLVGIMEDIDE